MFGNNPVRKQEQSDGQTLWVQEIFYTLQGEGPFSGRAAVFIRLGGCNLRCYFCDTDFESSDWYPKLSEILAAVGQHQQEHSHLELIVISGGEPLRQNISPLIQALLDKGFIVQLETAGTLSLPDLPFANRKFNIVCSPKTAKLHADMENAHFWKYVIDEEVDPEDGLPLASTQQAGRRSKLARPLNDQPVWVMPCDRGDPNLNQKNLELATESALKHGYRLCIQLHKQAKID